MLTQASIETNKKCYKTGRSAKSVTQISPHLSQKVNIN